MGKYQTDIAKIIRDIYISNKDICILKRYISIYT